MLKIPPTSVEKTAPGPYVLTAARSVFQRRSCARHTETVGRTGSLVYGSQGGKWRSVSGPFDASYRYSYWISSQVNILVVLIFDNRPLISMCYVANFNPETKPLNIRNTSWSLQISTLDNEGFYITCNYKTTSMHGPVAMNRLRGGDGVKWKLRAKRAVRRASCGSLRSQFSFLFIPSPPRSPFIG